MIDELCQEIFTASVSRPQEMMVTPLVASGSLSRLLGCEVLLKCEHLQTTGSFKFRGAANKIRLLFDAGAHSVITASSGNHGQAVALAAKNAGMSAIVYASVHASPMKLEAIRSHGAELVLVEGDSLQAELAARAAAEGSGKPFISPYNDLDVIAGQGTIGLEILDQAPDVDAVFAAVGGGGLAAGIGAILKTKQPSAEMIGCWPLASPAMLRAIEAGHIHNVHESETISDGTAGGVEPDALTFPLCRDLIDRRIAVDEQAIKQAMWQLADSERWIVEGAAGVALAGLAALSAQMRGRKVVVVLCGRNISASKYLKALIDASDGQAAPGLLSSKH